MKNMNKFNSKFNLEPITTMNFPENQTFSCEEADNKLVCTLLQKQSADASKHYIFITQKAKYLFTREEEFLNTKLRFPHFSYSVPGLCRRCPTWRASLCKFYITTATIPSFPRLRHHSRELFWVPPRHHIIRIPHTHSHSKGTRHFSLNIVSYKGIFIKLACPFLLSLIPHTATPQGANRQKVNLCLFIDLDGGRQLAAPWRGETAKKDSVSDLRGLTTLSKVLEYVREGW